MPGYPKVVIGYIRRDELTSTFCDSLVDLVLQDGDREYPRVASKQSGVIRNTTGPAVAEGRNTIVKRFLESESLKEADWLLFIDSDIVFPPTLIEQLLATAYPNGDQGRIRPAARVIAGLYMAAGRDIVFPCMFRMVDPKENDGYALAKIVDWTPNETLEVDACGAGCLMIARDLLEEMYAIYGTTGSPWFAESVYKSMHFSEDWTFCMRVQKMGDKILMNTAVTLGHVKSFTVTEEFWRTGESGWARHGAPPPHVGRAEQRRIERQRASV